MLTTGIRPTFVPVERLQCSQCRHTSQLDCLQCRMSLSPSPAKTGWTISNFCELLALELSIRSRNPNCLASSLESSSDWKVSDSSSRGSNTVSQHTYSPKTEASYWRHRANGVESFDLDTRETANSPCKCSSNSSQNCSWIIQTWDCIGVPKAWYCWFRLQCSIRNSISKIVLGDKRLLKRSLVPIVSFASVSSPFKTGREKRRDRKR